MVLEDAHQFTNLADAPLAQMVGHDGGRHIYAVQYVADIMQNARGHFGHSGDAGELDQPFLRIASSARACVLGVICSLSSRVRLVTRISRSRLASDSS